MSGPLNNESYGIANRPKNLITLFLIQMFNEILFSKNCFSRSIFFDFPEIFRGRTDHPGWISRSDYSGRDIFCNNRPGPDDGIRPDGNAWQDYNAITYETIISNGNPADLGIPEKLLGAGIMGNQPDTRSDSTVVTDRNKETMGGIKKECINDGYIVAKDQPSVYEFFYIRIFFLF